MPNSTKLTPKKKPLFREWRPRFIEALREYGVVSYAADEAGVTRSAAYKARDRNKQFAAEWDEALEEATDKLEFEARRRAYEGTDHPITFRGQITNTYKEYSDTLLIFLLKAHRPEKFRDHYNVDLTSGGEPVVVYLPQNERQDE